MSAIDTLRNDKDAIIGIISEHYILSQAEVECLRHLPAKGIFKSFDQHSAINGCRIIQHGEWVFCYHRDAGVLYIK